MCGSGLGKMTLGNLLTRSDFEKCVAGGLFPIFCKMSDEQQEQVVMNK